MGADPASILTQLAILVLLILVNAFFAAAEMAIVSINKNKVRRLAQEGNKKAVLLEKLIDQPTRFLSTIQVGITLAGFFSSASAATGISKALGGVLQQYGIAAGEQISFVVVTILLSFFTLVFGELYPKRVALQKAESIALFSVRPILFISKVAAPFIKLLSLTTNGLLRLTGMSTNNSEEQVSEEEIRSLLLAGEQSGAIEKSEAQMIQGVFSFDDKLAREIMTPRTKVYALNLSRPLDVALDELLLENYSRVPVYEEDLDHIIGILYLHDLLAQARKVGFHEVDLKSLLRPAYFVPERKRIDQLFYELRAQHNHIALLIDEYGGFSGIVTVEDLVEEVMGEIEDEYDERELPIRKIDASTYLLHGSVSVTSLNETLGLSLPEADEYDTLAGLLLKELGYLPETGASATVEVDGGLTFKIEKVENKRIEHVLLHIQPPAPAAVPPEEEKA